MTISDTAKPFLEEEFTIFDDKAIVRSGYSLWQWFR